MSTISERLTALRRERNLNQLIVADAIGTTRAAYAHYEQGIREPSIDLIKKLCLFYEVSADYLIGLSDDY